MHRSKSFGIIIRPHPNLAHHIHGPSKSTPRFGPSNSRSCKFSHPRSFCEKFRLL